MVVKRRKGRSRRAETSADSSSSSDASGASGTSDAASDASASSSGGEITDKSKLAPDPEEFVFDTWDECDDFVEGYFARTNQIRCTKEQNETARAVKRAEALEEGRAFREPKVTDVELTPSEWDIYSRLYICTHVGKYVPRGKGVRKKKKSRAAGCDASLRCCLKRDRTGRYSVCITKFELEHSHPLTASRYKTYPKNRMQLTDATIRDVDLLRRYRAPTEEIHRLIVETTPSNPRRYDVRKLVWRMRRDSTPEVGLASRIQSWMDQFASKHGNIGRVFYDENKVAIAIVFQTLHMRLMLARYPQVVMIDATHNTNAEGYKLFSFMVVDAFGQSQFVHHAFVLNEQKETIATVVRQFIRANPAVKNINCFMVDKHFTEIDVLRSEFTEAEVLLCQFHDVKYLREVVSKFDLSPQQRSSLKDAIGLIVYATSEDSYNKTLAYIRRIHEPQQAPSGGAQEEERVEDTVPDLMQSSDTSGFYDYFLRNWHECRDMWCSYARDNVETIGVKTNNRLEATWKHVKKLVRRSDHLDETLGYVEHYPRKLEVEYRHNANPISHTIHDDYDDIISDFANLVTDYAVELVFPEYKFGMRAVYDYQLADGEFTVQSTRQNTEGLRRVFKIQKSSWTCSCMFMAAKLLPCRHVIHIRQKERLETVFPPARRNC